MAGESSASGSSSTLYPKAVDVGFVRELQQQDTLEELPPQGGLAKDARTESSEASASVGDTAREEEVELPFCFMTLALNAMPFITHHAPVFDEVGQILSKRAAAAWATENGDSDLSSPPRQHANGGRDSLSPNDEQALHPSLPPPEFFWEWHVVEGVAAGRANHAKPYSQRRVREGYFDSETGLSVDGTTQYLDDIAAGGLGDGVSSRLIHLHRRCGRKKPGSRQTPGEATGVAESYHTDGGSRASSAGALPDAMPCLWRDKTQMVNAAAFALEHECLLVQIDSDELWTAEQLVRMRDMFLLERNGSEGDRPSNTSAVDGAEWQPFLVGNSGVRSDSQHSVGGERHPPIGSIREGSGSGEVANKDQPQQPQHQEGWQHNHRRREVGKRECAYFHCHFFVGPNLVTVTEDGWGHAVGFEWLRAWVFRPRETVWLGQDPPDLARQDKVSGWKLLLGDHCIGRDETREWGLVFTHYSYVLEKQVGGALCHARLRWSGRVAAFDCLTSRPARSPCTFNRRRIRNIRKPRIIYISTFQGQLRTPACIFTTIFLDEIYTRNLFPLSHVLLNIAGHLHYVRNLMSNSGDSWISGHAAVVGLRTENV